MARIRTIKPEFFTSEQVVECSVTARLLFIGMWNFCDDSGIHPAALKTLKMEVFPGDDITVQQVESCIKELISVGLIMEYEIENKRYWLVTGWHHQRIEKPNYRHPLPDGSTPSRGAVGDHSPTEKEKERKGRESKGGEGKANPGTYAFSGKIIRLNHKDMSELLRIYHAIPDMQSELFAIDQKFSADPPPTNQWWIKLNGWLKSRHEKLLKSQPRQQTKSNVGTL